MQQFAILAGLPGSGKSTLARRLKSDEGYFVVSTDAIRLALNAGEYPSDDESGDYALLDPVVWPLAWQAVAALLRTGRNVAIDATNLSRAKRRFWADLARTVAPEVRVVVWWCAGNYDTPQRWWETRKIPEAQYWTIRRKLEAQVEEPSAEEGFEVRRHG